jgi:DNA mismatch repair protein MutS
LLLDAATQRNLELVRNSNDGGRKNTLLSIMDHAATPMGSRLIKKWIQRPLINKTAIIQRQDVVGVLVKNITVQTQLYDLLNQFGDIERIVGRIGVRRAQPHDYSALKKALYFVPFLHGILEPFKKIPLIDIIDDHLGDFYQLHQLLVAALHDDSSQEWIIKKGFDLRLDQLRELVEDSSQAIMRMEQEEQEKTGIQSLKIRYNQVYGYYIEITKPNVPFVPDHYVRQQTLVGRERYITAALQQLQSEIVSAQDQIKRVEKELFEVIKNEVFA